MQVILLSDVRGSGKKGEVVKVSDGYAKNFLFPKKLAKEANNQSLTELNAAKEVELRKKELEKQEALKIFEVINGKSVDVPAECGEGGKLFGSVTSKDIVSKIKEVYEVNVNKKKVSLEKSLGNYEVNVNKKKVSLDSDIKSLGNYTVKIKLYRDVTATMQINVVDCKVLKNQK